MRTAWKERMGWMIGVVALVLLASASLPSARAQRSGEDTGNGRALLVTVRNVESSEGWIRALLFRSEEGFPNDRRKAIDNANVRARRGAVTLAFPDVPDGVYAVAVIHDEDGDGELDTNLFGVPTEAWGVSNDAEASTFGPPDFTEARFRFRGPRGRTRLDLNY